MKTIISTIKIMSKIALSCLAVIFFGCGGGGGGGPSDDPVLYGAQVELNREPGSVGLGDRIFLSVHVYDVDPNGFIIKFKYPSALNYVANTCIIDVNEQRLELDPIRSERTIEGDNHLAFFIPPEAFIDDDSGELKFYLRATSLIEDGSIEVDTQVHNPAAKPHNEYNAQNPLFSPKDSESIEVYS